MAESYLCSLPNALISTSTPAGRSSFISASTVCCVGSRISSRRLWVRISNASRDFLSTCGERNTQYLFFEVGRGMGSFFFSSRRRHTRLQGDWSSDVCSSDLDDADRLVAHAAAGLDRLHQLVR